MLNWDIILAYFSLSWSLVDLSVHPLTPQFIFLRISVFWSPFILFSFFSHAPNFVSNYVHLSLVHLSLFPFILLFFCALVLLTCILL